MTKISTYVVDEKVTALDKWIGSDANMQNRTKNFTPKKLAAYFNEDQVINIGTPLQYKYYTLDPLEARPNGTLTFETEIGPTVNFSSITTFLLSKYTTKQNIVSDFLNFLDGSKVLLFKSSDINSFGFYRISSLEPYEPDPNFFVVTVSYETGNGALEEDEDYMISLVSLAGDFIPTKTSELINDGDDGVNPFISELDIDRTEWDAAYEGKINSAEVTGDTTKTLTLTKQDGSTIEASWTDKGLDLELTTTGTSGVATLVGSVLNIPDYTIDTSEFVHIEGDEFIYNTKKFYQTDSIVSQLEFNNTRSIDGLASIEMVNTDGASSIDVINSGAGEGVNILNSGEGYGQIITNQDAGFGLLVNNDGSGTSGIGGGIKIIGTSYAPSFTISNSAQGDAIFVNSIGTSAGTPINLQQDGVTNFQVSKLGDVTANKLIKSGGTSGQYLMADGSVSTGPSLAGYVPTSRLLSINGTQYDLSTDRSWSVGTVTSVSELTIGTSGTDLSSSVATGTTTPVITLNVPTASATNRGALSAADWSTFNTKVGDVTASSPLASSGGSTPNITIQQSSGSQDGYLSSTDWNTFNNKQVAGNYITSLTGEATASGPGAASVTLNNASVTAKILSGVNITGGTILDTDTMLTAFGKLQNQINSLIGGSIYQGVWNASTNTPTLTSSVGTDGNYYIVNVAGSTNLNGITDWKVGDWAIFHGGTWQKVDNTDAVSSVNGFTGAVSLTTDNIPEGLANQYFLNSRARAALSFAAGSGAYNSTTGVITIPTNNNQITNGSNFITLASLSGSAPIQYNNTTGAISITQAGAASNGYLSSTDWNTFNNKQVAGSYVTTNTTQTITGVKVFNDFRLQLAAAGTSQPTVLQNSSSISSGSGGYNTFGFNSNSDLFFNDGTTNAGILSFSNTTTRTYTLPDASGTIALTSNLHNPVTISTTGAINGLSIDVSQQLSITTASSSANGALSSTDWDTFNSKLSSLSGAVLTTTDQTVAGVKKFTDGLTSDKSYNQKIISGTFMPDAGYGNFFQNDRQITFVQFNSAATAVTQFSFIYPASNTNQFYYLPDASGTLALISDAINNGVTTIAPSQNAVFDALALKQNLLTNPITGSTLLSGNTGDGYVPRASGSTTLTNSNIYDDGTNVGIGTTSPAEKLDVNGSVNVGAGIVLLGQNKIDGSSDNLKISADYGNVSGSSSIEFLTDGTEKMRITSGGNVGIGTTSPSRTLHVLGQTGIGTVLKLEGASGTTTYLQLAYNGATNAQSGYISYDSSANMGFFTNDAEKMRITSGGNVGIGTESPDQKLTVDGNIRAAGVGNGFLLDTTGSNFTNGMKVVNNFETVMFNGRGSAGYVIAGDNNLRFGFGTNYSAGETIRITSGGNVGIGTTSPAQKLHIGGVGSAIAFDTTGSSGSILIQTILDYELSIKNTRGTSSEVIVGDESLRLATNSLERMRIRANGIINIDAMPYYANNAAALAGGLTYGDLYYSTDASSATVKIVINFG